MSGDADKTPGGQARPAAKPGTGRQLVDSPPEPGAGAPPGAAGSLVVVMEPPGEGQGRDADAVFAEGRRLALALGMDIHPVTWPAEPRADDGVLAAAVAEAAARVRAAAVLLVDTDLGRSLAPLVAHRLGSGAVVSCSDVLVRQGAMVFVKPVYGGWLEQEVDPAPGSAPVVTLDIAAMPEPDSDSETAVFAEVLALAAPDEPRIRHLETVPPDPRTVDLAYARRIVAAGMGSVGEGLLEAVRELAELLEGSVGATRPVVDDGHLPKERLIGQTGRSVTPDLYLALGLSGSPHHVAGVKQAGKIVSVNRDVRAPIFQFSDVGFVGDLEVVLPALMEKIKEWRDARGGV